MSAIELEYHVTDDSTQPLINEPTNRHKRSSAKKVTRFQRRRRRPWRTLLLLVTILVLIAFILIIIYEKQQELDIEDIYESDASERSHTNDVAESSQNPEIKPRAAKQILLKHVDDDLDFSIKDFQCNTGTCVVTNGWQNALSSIKAYNAIIYNYDDNNEIDNMDVPQQGNSNQTFVFAMKKPQYIPKNFNYDAFNATMTYYSNSDIVWRSHQVIPTTGTMQTISEMSTNNYTALVSAKSGIATYYQESLCSNTTKNAHIFDELKNYINITVIGNCQNNTCDIQCSDVELSNFKFLLIIEDWICPDYISNIFYEAIENMVVPVVYNSTNYSLLESAELSVGIDGFHNLYQLANHLHILIDHEHEYSKYLDQVAKVSKRIQKEQLPICHLCDLLNNENKQKNNVRNQMMEWMSNDYCHLNALIDISISNEEY